jgi:colanic acid biosynthesis glycosyl transferase WcaI
VPARVTSLKRILHEATFVLTSMIRVLSLKAPDIYFVASPPLVLGMAAWFVGLLKRAPFIFHVQDLQPDAALGLGMLRSGLFTRALYALESFAYDKAARVSGITRGMLDIFRNKGVPPAKLIYFPNAVDLSDRLLNVKSGEFRGKHGFANDEFIAAYAGNLGVKQGLDVLIEAARLLRNPRIRIVLCGDGAQRINLEEQVRQLQLPNVSMVPLQAGADYLRLLLDVDLCFITQQAGSGNSFFPSKLLGILAAAKPVVTVAAPETELACSLVEGQFGVNVEPGRPQELAEVLDALADDPTRLQRFGVSGRQYVEQFEKNRVLEQFARELGSVVSPASL